MDYLAIVEETVEKARKLGAEQAEAYLTISKDLSIQVSKQAIETLKSAEEHGIGIRVINGGKMGFASTADLQPSAIKSIVNQAVQNAEGTTADEYLEVPSAFDNYPKVDIYDPEINNVPVEQKIEIAKETERITLNQDKRVTRVERAVYEDSDYSVFIANSSGLTGQYQGSYCGAFVYSVAEQGTDIQTGFGMSISRRFRDLDINIVGKEGAERATRLLGGKTITSQKVPVVFDPYIATEFLGIVAGALTAEAVQKGRSLYIGKLGQQVAASGITIIDNGIMENGIASSPFDGEGVPTERTVLIQDGVLQGYLYNTYTAKKDGKRSTGNAARSSYKGVPKVGTTNFYIHPGKISREALIKDVQNGFYVMEVMGMHTANPVSGDFSVGAAGVWIRNGQFAEAVRGVAIAGNITELFNSVDAVADDLRFFGGTGAPTIRIAKMAVSGD